MLLVKAVAAFCLGALALAGVQHAYVWAIQQQLKSDRPAAGLPSFGASGVATSFKGPFTADQIMPKHPAVDTAAGQRAAIGALGHRIDLQHRAAQGAVPLPPRIQVPRR